MIINVFLKILFYCCILTLFVPRNQTLKMMRMTCHQEERKKIHGQIHLNRKKKSKITSVSF